MGFLDKLKNAFSGGGAEAPDEGLYLYIRLDPSGEVVRLRLNPAHELNIDFERGGFVSRKSIVGPRKFGRAEAAFRFDDNRRLSEWDISNGTLVSEEDWLAQEQEVSRGRHNIP